MYLMSSKGSEFNSERFATCYTKSLKHNTFYNLCISVFDEHNYTGLLNFIYYNIPKQRYGSFTQYNYYTIHLRK